MTVRAGTATMMLLLTLTGAIDARAQQQEEPEKLLPMYLSARDLLKNCAASSLTGLGRERRRFCAGFVSGVEEAMRLVRTGGATGDTRAACPPTNVSARQLAEAYLRYANQAGQELDRPAAEVVAEALRAAYPCP